MSGPVNKKQPRGLRQSVVKAMLRARKKHGVDELNWESRLFSVSYVASVRESLLSYIDDNTDNLGADWAVAMLALQAGLQGQGPSPGTWYGEVFNEYPPCAYLELCMGDHFMHQASRFHKARSHYQAAVNIDPRLTIAYYNLGLAYQVLGLFHLLEEPNQEVVAVARHEEKELKARALFNMAGFRQQVGDRTEAFRLLTRALETWPEFPEAMAVMQQVRTGWA